MSVMFTLSQIFQATPRYRLLDLPRLCPDLLVHVAGRARALPVPSLNHGHSIPLYAISAVSHILTYTVMAFMRMPPRFYLEIGFGSSEDSFPEFIR